MTQLQKFLLVCIGGITLLLLGVEPNNSESSMYEYEHFTDKGHFGWYLCWLLVLFVCTFVITLVTKSFNQKQK